uniref:Phosphatase domain containing paladin 1 n=1 Tax=Naja naja TaxID=35670 RepID=A0A8C6Y671_NAJNA
MGTTASTAQQTVATATFENIHGSGAMEDHHSLSIHSFQTIGLHNNKAKSIITNKVAPVVITYNCKEEFQIHDDLLKASYTVGRITESTPEHYLVQGKYFMVRDVHGKLDVLNTSNTFGAPNFRQAKGGYAVFGMGQPSFGGFKQVLQKLQNDGHKECIVFCVREEPVLFLRMDNDFIPYTPRAKENLKDNLHNLHRGVRVEDLEVSIRKEIHDFAQLSENVYYIYNDIEHFKDEPHSVKIFCEEDIQVTEEVYKRPVFLLPSYRYHRLPLPVDGAPLEAQFDAFISFLRESPNLLLLQDPSKPPPALVFSCQTGVGTTNFAMVLGTLLLYHRKGGLPKQDLPQSPKYLPREQFRIIQNFIGMVPNGQQIVEEVDAAIALCSEMYDVKEAIYEYKRKLEATGEDYQNQKNSTKECFLQKMLQRLECYFFLIAFNYYLHEQYPLAFALNFSRWICRHPELYRLQANMNLSELTITAEHITKGVRVLAIGNVLNYLTDAKRKHSHILWINLREDIVLEENEQTYTLREVGNLEQQITVPVASSEQLEKLESVLKNDLLKSQKRIEVYLEQEKQMKTLKSCLTMQEIFNQHKSNCQGLAYKRIPVPDFCGLKEKDFDQMLEAMKGALAEDSHTAFVFNCHSGRGRTTTAMVIAVLILWHFNGIPEIADDEIVSVPDAKYTKGEFEVVMKVLQILPEGHRMKKEVDMALDTVSETMTPMHYHLREIIISTYRQGKTAKEEAEVQTLQLRSLQFLERYIYLILFNAYLHLVKKDSWEKPFSIWMHEVAAKAGVYEILNQLGFSEFETQDSQALSQLRYRWQEQSRSTLPFRGEFI